MLSLRTSQQIGVAIRTLMKSRNFRRFSGKRIPTSVCALARNDSFSLLSAF